MRENPGLSKKQRIEDIKQQIKDKAKAFYLFDKVSDGTKIGSKQWKEIKAEVCAGEDFKRESWYTSLMEH